MKRIAWIFGSFFLVAVLNQSATADDTPRDTAIAANHALVQAGVHYKAGKYGESVEQIKRAQKLVEKVLADAKPEEARTLLRPIAGRLKKAHAMLELQGYSLPPLVLEPKSSPDKPEPKPNEGVTFAKDVAPILISRCGRCHIEKAEGNLSMRSFASLMKGADGEAVIEPGDASGSTLVEAITSGEMPAGGRKLTNGQIATIEKWINTGAKLDAAKHDSPLTSMAPDAKIEPPPRVVGPPEPGDGPVSFAGHVAPVLAAQCIGCHGARNPRANLSLVDFNRIMRGGDNGAIVSAGKGAASLLVRKLKGQEGARMPLERPALPPKTIAAIERWINEGAKFDGSDRAQTLADLSALYLARTASHAQLSVQRAELAEKNWKLTIPDESPNVVEMDDVRLYGTAGETKLKQIGEIATKQSKAIRSLLGAPHDKPLVKGGINFFVFSQRIDYSEFGRMVEKRTLPRGWRGHSKFTITDAYIALVPPKSSDEGLEAVVTQHIAGLYIGNLTAGKGPRWLIEGTARAITEKLVRGDERVKQWRTRLKELQSGIESSDEFLKPTLPPDDADIVSFGFASTLTASSTKLKNFLYALRSGKSVDAAFEKAFGGKVKDKADAWAKSSSRRRPRGR